MPQPPPVVQIHLANRNRLLRNNNNGRHPLIHIRDHLFHTAFVRISLLYARLFSEQKRKMIECLFLALSFLSLVTLIYIHLVFVRTPTNCLEGVESRWPRDGILRVEILQGNSGENYTLEKSYLKEKMLRQLEYDEFSYLFHSDPFFKEDIDRKFAVENLLSSHNITDQKYKFLNNMAVSGNKSIEKNIDLPFFPDSPEKNILPAWSGDECIMEFSLEYGFLKLSPATRKSLNISVYFITLDPHADKCFGSFFNKFILEVFLTYDEVLLASLKHLASKEEYKGYVRNVVSEVEFIFVNVWMDRKSYITAGFVMLVFTVSITILLRYSHHQIFVFIVELLHMLEFHSSFNFPAGPLLTVILALVGMEAIMSEFFNDTAIAFYVILIVWMADQFDAICCQTPFSKRHWLRFFYLYHFFFYAYTYRFGHNRFLALLTSWLFTMHSMIYFFHRYELPLLIANNNQNQNNNSSENQDDDTPPRAGSPRNSNASYDQAMGLSSRVDHSSNVTNPQVQRMPESSDQTSNTSSPTQQNYSTSNVQSVVKHSEDLKPMQNQICYRHSHIYGIHEKYNFKAEEALQFLVCNCSKICEENVSFKLNNLKINYKKNSVIFYFEGMNNPESLKYLLIENSLKNYVKQNSNFVCKSKEIFSKTLSCNAPTDMLNFNKELISPFLISVLSNVLHS